jgi:hypothetical protein
MSFLRIQKGFPNMAYTFTVDNNQLTTYYKCSLGMLTSKQLTSNAVFSYISTLLKQPDPALQLFLAI